MRSQWTPAVARALHSAQQWARRLGATFLEPDHLLFGLLEEEQGRAAVLLRQAGLDPAKVRAALEARPASGPAHLAESPILFNAALRAVLDTACDLAADFSVDRTVPSEAVLLALLRRDQGVRQLLESLGLLVGRLDREIRAHQGPPLVLDEPLNLAQPVEQSATARILDANANRAREAMRVVEDYCRFVLDDAYLSGQLKLLRHDLAALLEEIDPDQRDRLSGRDTPGDVGTQLSTDRERHRGQVQDVVQANLKRLEEALRSLEEFGKLHGPAVGERLEKLRYRSYTLEKAILLGTTARQRLAEARLYVLLTGSLCTASLDWTIAEAVAGGAQIIQLREKKLDDRALLERARQVRRWTRQAGALFILNDRPDIARLAEADGVHLGQEDLKVQDARRILGHDALIGVSTHNLEQVRQAVLDGASYMGVGPTFQSGTKEFTELSGLEFVRQALAETSLPAFVIGGVNLETIDAAVAAGARRVAVSQAIAQAEDPRSAAATLRRALN